MSGRLLVGTSGWNYKHWANGVFYPPGLKPAQWLDYNTQSYATVEVNNTFYGLPKRETFEKWRAGTPGHFRFVLKASRFYTHMKRLIDPQEYMAQFLEAAAGLETKLDTILFQLPRGMKFSAERLEGMLVYMTRQQIAPGVRLALEIRDESWNIPTCFDLLRQYNAALVFADWPSLKVSQPVTTNFVYLRRHGPRALYASGYSEEQLQQDAAVLRGCREQGMDGHAFFNNDFGGYAIRDSQRLMQILE